MRILILGVLPGMIFYDSTIEPVHQGRSFKCITWRKRRRLILYLAYGCSVVKQKKS